MQVSPHIVIPTENGVARTSTYRTLIHNKFFVIYWTGSTLVLLALQFVSISLAWFVLKTTGSSVRVAIILAVIPIARMATSPFIGRLLDRLPRRRLMVIDNVGQAILYLSIPIMTWMHILTFPILVGVVTAAAALSPLSMIGRGVLLPNLVSANDLEVANGFSQFRSGLVTLLGPAVGGILVAAIGAPLTLLVTAACYAAYVLSLMGIPATRYRTRFPRDPSTTSDPAPNPWSFLWSSPALLIIGMVTLFFNLTYGPLEPALPVMVDRVYHSGAGTLGLVWSSFAVGSLLGTLLWSRFRPQWSLRWFITGVIIGWGLFSGLTGFTTHPWEAMLTLFGGGLVYSPYNIVAATWQQRLIPDHLRGSVFGVFQSVTSSGLPVGQLIGGVVVSVWGAGATITIGGAATMLLGLVVASLRAPWSRVPDTSVSQ